MIETIAGVLGAAAIAGLLVRDYRRIDARRREEAEALFGLLEPLMQDARRKPTGVAGAECIEGRIGGRFVQIRTVTDTLSLRKLPSLWLMITLPGETGLAATLNLMMRPAGQTSFSNFDSLPDTLPLPSGFPEEAVLKSDDEALAPYPELFRPCLPPYEKGYGKELLATPKGVRLVVQIAEGDRARYGVLRQAHFETGPIRPEFILPHVDMLADLLDRLRAARQSADEEPANIQRIARHG